jgi:hypothetical protein
MFWGKVCVGASEADSLMRMISAMPALLRSIDHSAKQEHK